MTVVLVIAKSDHQLQDWDCCWAVSSLDTSYTIPYIGYTLSVRLPHLTREALFEEENSKIKRDIAWMVCGTYFQGVFKSTKYGPKNKCHKVPV